MNNNINQAFASSVFGVATNPIIVYFNNGHEPAEYTKNILHLLKTDKTVEIIVDGLTGEIIWERGIIK